METQIPSAVPVPGATPAFQFPSSRQLFNESWELYKIHFKNLILLSLVPLAVIFVGGIIAGILSSMRLESSLSTPIFIVLAIAFGLFIVYLSIWSFAASVHYISSETHSETPIKDAYNSSSHDIFPLLFTGILTGLAVMGGFILLIIPGIIFSFWFSQSSFVTITEKISGPNALKQSKLYVKGNVKEIIKKGLYIGIITFGIAIIVGLLTLPFRLLGNSKAPGEILNTLFQIAWSPLATIYAYRLFIHLRNSKKIV